MTLLDKNFDPLASQLEQVLDQGRAPAEYSEWGIQLLKRLQKPVQIMVAGPPRSGKSALVDMLLGQQVIGKFSGCSSVEVHYGPARTAVFETAKGQSSQQPGLLADLAYPAEAVRVRQYLPAPALRKVSYSEISLTESSRQMQEMLFQAASYADILLWCSETFGASEQALWASVPDSKKDHSFLILTMADRQLMRGTLTGLIEELEPVAAEEFLGVYPVASIQGLTAQAEGSKSNPGLWRSSGGQRLFDDVMHQAEMGRSSDVDQAEMLIRQFGSREEPKHVETPRPPQPVEADVASAAPRQPEPAPASPPRPEPASAPVSDVLGNALELLQKNATEMLDRMGGSTGSTPEAILGDCMNTVQELSEILMESQNGLAVTSAIKDAVQEGEEMLMLLQLEQNGDAAADAVTVLLQLNKEIAAEAPD